MIWKIVLVLILITASALFGYLIGCIYNTDRGLLPACILLYQYISPDHGEKITKSLAAESEEEAQYYSEKAAIFTDLWLLGKFYQDKGHLLEDLINDKYYRSIIRDMLKQALEKKEVG